MRAINLVVFHCSATEEGRDYSVETIDSWHKARGFRKIGYHLIVHPDGSWETGREVNEIGAHAKGYNRNSIGIVYIGGLRDGKPADTRTMEQKKTLHFMEDMLDYLYPGVKFTGHRDLSVDLNGDGVITKQEWMKSCPCFDYKTEF